MIMGLRIFISVTVVWFAGCSSAVKPDTVYGSFVPAAQAGYETQMADDVARQLVSLYPPASTHFTLMHAAQDAFGKELIEKLRGQGYALREVAPPAPASASPPPAEATDTSAGTSLSYVLDSVTYPRLYRVTLNIGRQTISRAYIQQNDLVHPAGAWARKE
jgi:hypothetical protein